MILKEILVLNLKSMKRIISSGSIKIRDQWVRKISQIEVIFQKTKLLERFS